MAEFIASLVVGNEHRTAFTVQVKNSDVYVNYMPNGKRQHTSYHASGQHHQKIDRNYVLWSGGACGRWEPLKQVKPKPSSVHDREHVATIGWAIKDIGAALPLANGQGDLSIDPSSFPDSSILAFEVSVVGSQAGARTEIAGFPVVQRRRISGGVEVEIEAFLLSESEDRS